MAERLAALRRAAVGVLAAATAWGSGLALLTIFVVNIAHIAYRTVGPGWVWVADLSSMLFLWVVMLGAAAAYGLREHIVTGFLLDRLGGRPRTAAAVVIRVVEICFFLALAVSGAAVAAARTSIDYIQLGVSTAWAYWAIPVGGAVMLVMAVALPARSVTETAAADAAEAFEVREGRTA